MLHFFININTNYKFLLLLLLLINACGKSNYLAPVVFKGQSSISNNQEFKTITVREGSTLYSISRMEKVSVRSLIKVNNLKPPFILYKGDKLIVPSAIIHVVNKGDTLWEISKCYNVDITDIINNNNLSNNELSIGEKLVIPARNYNRADRCKSLSKEEYIVEVNINETKKDNVNIDNTLKSNYIWPVKGKILSKFGKQKKGLRNDGVNIVANKGHPVLAIQDGKVVYSGNEIQAFGNLILIKHSNNKTSAYAHLEEVKVIRGQLVKKGELIAKVGSTGKVDKPQLHFEIRDKSGPLDPLKFLPSRKL